MDLWLCVYAMHMVSTSSTDVLPISVLPLSDAETSPEVRVARNLVQQPEFYVDIIQSF